MPVMDGWNGIAATRAQNPSRDGSGLIMPNTMRLNAVNDNTGNTRCGTSPAFDIVNELVHHTIGLFDLGSGPYFDCGDLAILLSTRFQKFAHVFRSRKENALADLRGMLSQNAVCGQLPSSDEPGVNRTQGRLRGSILHSSAKAFLIRELAHY